MSPLAASPAAADGWKRHDGARNFHRGSDCFRRDGRRFCTGRVAPAPGPRHSHVDRHLDGGEAAAAAILGLAGVAIIAGALSSANRPVREYRTAPNAYPPAPSGPRVITYESRLQPWSPEWYRWCDARYRSFNPQTGTYRGYDGLDHFCVPK
ncbi:BA14K family protein [Oricola thermophila]|uniref:Lectin-like protein BA14k n=2 Tax=Oricola thermophila TaxID=2742145 RepID=A0A6N1VHT9_9HYPH|nr:BA14K family protein [Oricola thermophila]